MAWIRSFSRALSNEARSRDSHGSFEPSEVFAEREEFMRRGRRAPSLGIRWSAHRLAALMLVVLAIAPSAPLARAQASPPSEYQVKAAFLFNFAKFVDWPPASFASPQAPFSICLLGKDPFGPAIDDSWQGKSIGDHR